jgi:hypothetical protein
MEFLRVGGLAVAERSRGGRLPVALLVLSLIVVGINDFWVRTCTLGWVKEWGGGRDRGDEKMGGKMVGDQGESKSG